MSSFARLSELPFALPSGLGWGLRRSLIQEPNDLLRLVRRLANKADTTGRE